MLPGSIFDYHLILNEVSRSPMFLLDDVPRMFVAPWARLPRNYVDSNEQCTVRFHRGTSFPWAMTLIGATNIGRFPAYTPVLPAKAVYELASYDPVTGLGYIERSDDSLDTPAELIRGQKTERNVVIPPVNDYQKAFEERLPQSVMALPQPITSTFAEKAVKQDLPTSLCTRNQRAVRFTFAEPSEFYEVANNPNNQIPAKNEEFSDLNSYLNLLNRNFATMVNENANKPTNAQSDMDEDGAAPQTTGNQQQRPGSTRQFGNVFQEPDSTSEDAMMLDQ